MPSDKHKIRTAWAKDLIFSVLNITLSRDVPFHHQQQLQHLQHSATFVSIVLLFFLHNYIDVGDNLWRHLMASVMDIKIAEALLTLFFCIQCYEMT